MTAPNVEEPGPVAAGRAQDQGDSQQADSASEAAELQRKADATRVARAALAGIQLVRLADGTWLASKFGLTKHLSDSDLDGWLLRVGVPA